MATAATGSLWCLKGKLGRKPKKRLQDSTLAGMLPVQGTFGEGAWIELAVFGKTGALEKQGRL